MVTGPFDEDHGDEFGTMAPNAKNPDLHRRARMGYNSTAGQKMINRVQDCHPQLREDYRARWMEDGTGPEPSVQGIPRRPLLNLAHLEAQRCQRKAAESAAITKKQKTRLSVLVGSADGKAINRTQMCHPALRDDSIYSMKGEDRSASAMDVARQIQQENAASLERPRAVSVSGMREYGNATTPPARGHTAPLMLDVPAGKAHRVASPARRELCNVTSQGRCPTLPPCLSGLTPVPTMSWNGMAGHHPRMPSHRSQGLWREELQEVGALFPPSSPGAGSLLTPGIGRSLNSRGGGRQLRPKCVTGPLNVHALDTRSPPPSPSVHGGIYRAGGGGAAEMRQRTKGDRIWLSGTSWMSFS